MQEFILVVVLTAFLALCSGCGQNQQFSGAVCPVGQVVACSHSYCGCVYPRILK
jgi:hypothetical protein